MRPTQNYKYSVLGSDVDSTLHMRLSNICNMLLEVAGKDAKAMGFGSEALAGKDLGWVITKMAVEYDSTPELYDEISIDTWVNENKRLTNMRCFRAFDKNGKEFLRASTIWCVIDFANRRPALLESIGSEFMDLTDPVGEPCETPRNLRPRQWSESELPLAFEHKVVYTELDFNKHLNSVRYIDMMCNAMPRELMESQGRRRFDLHFSKESHYDEILPVRYQHDGAFHRIQICRPDGSDACLGQLEILD